MPHADTQIFAPDPLYVEDAALVQFLSTQVQALDGAIVVLMDAVPETLGSTGLYAPAGIHTGKFRPDCGTVISSGVEVPVGARVLVQGYSGLWFRSRDTEAHWPDTLPCSMAPINDKLVVQACEPPKEVGGILIPDGQPTPQMATVSAKGSKVKGLEVGDRVVLTKRGPEQHGDFHVCRDSHIYAKVGLEFMVPKGREVRFYGVSETWWKDVVAVIE